MTAPSIASLNTRQITRFYEPIVMFEALSEACKTEFTSSHDFESTSSLVEPSERDKFHKFVYKLAYICAFNKGPATVTSFAVLQNNQTGQIILAFASNQITPEEGGKVKKYVKSVLAVIRLMGCLRGEERGVVREAALKGILIRNRPRVDVYLSNLAEFVANCLGRGFSESFEGRLESKLVALQGCTFVVLQEGKLDNDQYTQICIDVIGIINRLDALDFKQIGVLTQAHMTGSQGFKDWSGLRHCISRLKAYDQAVDELVKARRAWPEIFETKKLIIEHVPSSTQMMKPVANRSKEASKCIGRMTNDETVMNQFREFAESLQKFDLDKRIENQYSKGSFRPIVHSEVLVYDWIASNFQENEVGYFRGWKYIGSSKPTCKLCDYFFDAVGDHVQRRPSHGNVYVNWRLPDGYGAGSRDKGSHVYSAMMKRVRNDTFKLLAEKSGTGKPHDSDTYSGWTTRQTEAGTDVTGASDAGIGIEGLSSRLVQQLILDEDSGSVRGQPSEFGAD